MAFVISENVVTWNVIPANHKRDFDFFIFHNHKFQCSIMTVHGKTTKANKNFLPSKEVGSNPILLDKQITG